MTRGVVLALLCTMATACDPPWSAPDTVPPVAMRTAADGDVEVLLLRCGPARLQRIEVFRGDGPFDGDETIVWDVVFQPASDVRSIMLGRVPSGANEQIGWTPDALGSDRNQRFVVRVTDDDRAGGFMSFALSDLDNGQVRYNSRSVSAQAYAATEPCQGRR